jgi:hypothetical protein
MKNSEKKLRFGIIDIAIVIAVCVLLAGAVLRYGLSGTWGSSDELDNFVVSFVVFSKNPDSVDTLAQGESVYFKESGNYFGSINSGLSIMPAEDFVTLPSGAIVKGTAVDGKVDVRGSLNVKGFYKDGEGFFQNGTMFIAAGQNIAVNTQNSDFTMLILDISRADK